MDSVRFGRALGFGARSAAKALAGAVDAATAPNPTPARTKTTQAPEQAPRLASTPAATSSPGPPRAGTGDPVASAARSAARLTSQARQVGKGISRGRKRFGEAAWGPFVKLSGVLWLEMTGAFFGIFALFAGQATWTHRTDLLATPLNHAAHRNALVFLGMTLVFGYFCISSFVRARLRQRSQS